MSRLPTTGVAPAPPVRPARRRPLVSPHPAGARIHPELLRRTDLRGVAPLHRELQALQRTVGNRGLASLLASPAATPPVGVEPASPRRAAASPGRVIQRAISIGGTPFTAAEVADALKADEDVVWRDAYIPVLEALDKAGQAFDDQIAVLMWLAGEMMAARPKVPVAGASGSGAGAVPTTTPETATGKSPAKRAAPVLAKGQVSDATLKRVAPHGTTAGQRYDKKGDKHVSVTFTIVRQGVFNIVGLHRTLPSGSHIYWAQRVGGGVFGFSTSSGTPIAAIAWSKPLEDAWKAVSAVAAKLGCEAVEPTWT